MCAKKNNTIKKQSQRILFLYLNTGNGHKTIANSVKKGIECYPHFLEKDKLFLKHGFNPKYRLLTMFYEGGYRFTIDYLPGAYSFFYDINCNKHVLNISKHFTVWGNVRYLKHIVKKHTITKIVSFHFAVSPIAEKVIQRYFPHIQLINVITDPYTAHPAWFLTKKAGYVFFSQQLADYYVPKCNIDNYTIQPFPIHPIFKKRIKQKNNTEQFKVLIAGGGEGFKKALNIAKCFAKKEAAISLVIVCGRNKKLQKQLERIIKQHPLFDLQVYGFVHNMHELMFQSDCVISKCGASIVHEVLASGKPYIISQYIHGQEKGNMHFIKNNNCGWFIQDEKKIYQKVIELKNNQEYYDTICKNIEKCTIDSDLTEISKYIINF
ncbi:MAG TPA: glycosyltransferase [Treponemataceae bacterium]|nr:glycosyltransferase [Treponemataceae bacterium]